MPEVVLPPAGLPLFAVLVLAKLASSNTDAKRLIEQGGVTLAEQRLADPQAVIKPTQAGAVLKVGKRRFARLVT